MFDSILVANRGEIAARVLRTAVSQGYRTIAVYSEADADAPHVRLADEAVCIGPPPVAESYLDINRGVSAALQSCAGAIHPAMASCRRTPRLSGPVRQPALFSSVPLRRRWS